MVRLFVPACETVRSNRVRGGSLSRCGRIHAPEGRLSSSPKERRASATHLNNRPPTDKYIVDEGWPLLRPVHKVTQRQPPPCPEGTEASAYGDSHHRCCTEMVKQVEPTSTRATNVFSPKNYGSPPCCAHELQAGNSCVPKGACMRSNLSSRGGTEIHQQKERNSSRIEGDVLHRKQTWGKLQQTERSWLCLGRWSVGSYYCCSAWPLSRKTNSGGFEGGFRRHAAAVEEQGPHAVTEHLRPLIAIAVHMTTPQSITSPNMIRSRKRSPYRAPRRKTMIDARLDQIKVRLVDFLSMPQNVQRSVQEALFFSAMAGACLIAI